MGTLLWNTTGKVRRTVTWNTQHGWWWSAPSCGQIGARAGLWWTLREFSVGALSIDNIPGKISYMAYAAPRTGARHSTRHVQYEI